MSINMTNNSRNDPPHGPPMANEPDWLAKLQELDPRLAAPHLWSYQSPSEEFYLTIERARTTPDEQAQLHLVREPEDVIWLDLIYNEFVTPKVLGAIYMRNATKNGDVPKAYIAHALAEAPACPTTVIERLALTDDHETRRLIAQRRDASRVARSWLRQQDELEAEPVSNYNANTRPSHELLLDPSDAAGERYLEHLEDQPTIAQELYAENLAVDYPHTPDWVLQRIAKKTARLLADRLGAATNKNRFLEQPELAERTDLKHLIAVGRKVAKHPNASKDTLAILIAINDATILNAAVANPSAPKKAFDRLLKSPQGRQALARHASKGVRRHAQALIQTNEDAVLRALARNTHMRLDHLDLLAQLPDLEVVRRVASNTSTAPRTLESLLEHADPTVRGNAARNPSTPWDAILPLTERGDIHVISGSVSNPNAPDEHVLRYGTSVRAEDRRRLANAATTPGQLLNALASDDDPEVRLAAAANPATPPDSLEHLYLHDPLATVAEAVVSNPNYPERLLREAFAISTFHRHLAGNPGLPHDIQRQFASSRSEELRLRLAMNPNATPEVLKSLTSDTADGPDAVAAVLNPNYPLEEFESYLDYMLVPHTVGAARLLAQVALRPAAKTIGELFALFLRKEHDPN